MLIAIWNPLDTPLRGHEPGGLARISPLRPRRDEAPHGRFEPRLARPDGEPSLHGLRSLSVLRRGDREAWGGGVWVDVVLRAAAGGGAGLRDGLPGGGAGGGGVGVFAIFLGVLLPIGHFSGRLLRPSDLVNLKGCGSFRLDSRSIFAT